MSLKIIMRVLLVLSFGVGSMCMYGAEGSAGGGMAATTLELMRDQQMMMMTQMMQQNQKAGAGVSAGGNQLSYLRDQNTVLMGLLSYAMHSRATDLHGFQRELHDLMTPVLPVRADGAVAAAEGVAADESVSQESLEALQCQANAVRIRRELKKEELDARPEQQKNAQSAAQDAIGYSYYVSQYRRENPHGTLDTFKIWIQEKINENLELMGRPAEVKEASLFTHAAMQGLAGPNGRFLFNNMRADTSILGAVGAGLTFRTMTVVGDEFEKILRQEGGPLVDAVVGKPVRGLSTGLKRIWNWLFHGGARSYTVEQIAHWKSEVLDVVLKGLADYASKAQYDQGNGFGAQARVQRYDDFDGASLVEQAESEESPGDVTWLKFVDGLAKDLDRLTIRIEVPKRFYSPSDDEDEALMASDGRLDLLDMATRIQEVLQFIKEYVLLPTRTLKDLATGDLKFLLPRLSSEIAARFSLFESMVRQYHGLHIKPQSSAHDSAVRKEGSPRGGYAGGGYAGYDQQQGGVY